MTPARFARIVEVYGANPNKWPPVERDAALSFHDLNPQEAEVAYRSAASLDDLLGLATVPPPSVDLRERIVASGKKARSGLDWRIRLWWQGTGLASAGIAGMIAGAMLINTLQPATFHGDDEEDYFVTAFDTIAIGGDE